MLEDPSWLRDRECQAFAVLTMCRALYTLRHGAVVSKPAAARWAREALDYRWAAVIERALAWRHQPQADDLDETLHFLWYTLERARQCEMLEVEA